MTSDGDISAGTQVTLALTGEWPTPAALTPSATAEKAGASPSTVIAAVLGVALIVFCVVKPDGPDTDSQNEMTQF
jgi:hypothetical protein